MCWEVKKRDEHYGQRFRPLFCEMEDCERIKNRKGDDRKQASRVIFLAGHPFLAVCPGCATRLTRIYNEADCLYQFWCAEKSRV